MSSASEELRVLHMPFQRVHFLLNTTQCSGSLFIHHVTPLRSRYPYARETIPVDGETLLLLDLTQFWCDSFRVPPPAGASLAIIVEPERFRRGTRQWLANSLFPRLARSGVTGKALAFRLPSATAIHPLRTDELAYHPAAFQGHMNHRGMLAVHPCRDSMGFLVDIDQLIRSGLLFAGQRENR